MEYSLDSLGAQNFEQLTQSLMLKKIGTHMTVFGDGADGGREATWRGEAPTFGKKPSWTGYGVLQAKFKQRSESPSENLKWLKTTIKRELLDWQDPDSKRSEKPDFLLFVTNIRLSSVPGHGKDEIQEYLDECIADLDLKITESRVLDYYEIRGMLDSEEDVRRRYAAFLTTGDVIAKLVDNLNEIEAATGVAITNYTAKCLVDDNHVNLTQAGTAGDGRVTIADVFVDLPADIPDQEIDISINSTMQNETDSAHLDEYTFNDSFEYRSGITRYLINEFNHIMEHSSSEQSSQRRTVLVGGPGQGKSTVTQWLAQLYRAEFLKESKAAETSTIRTIIRETDQRRAKLQLPEVRARRWPIRIILTELADYLASAPNDSLFHYLAAQISHGSSHDMNVSMLRKWLATYPSLLLIDGLDEVPSSSNRGQVLDSIRNFFIETTSIGADVFAVATTRPQGYSDEFSPEEYRHFRLEALSVDEALDFAEGLVAARVGAGTAAEQKVMKRLKIASQEEHTMKLFESPLQVTILEVLLEKLHKAPNDRSRLYSAYFNVISQREQEKSGTLSDLLQKYETDVNFLHRKIGYVLQKRGAEVGETTSSLLLDEFDRFIRERFEEQGHTPEEVAQLASQFSSLVTDRLVFLAKLESDKIGFELRSLQEFMAGEFIVNKPEQEVISELQKISHSAYWRNVVLFAIGSIFSNKEHLRADINVLCNELNISQPSSRIVLAGSELAVDILRDGSCLSMPKFARGLFQVAFAVLSYPDPTTVEWLASLANTDYAESIWEEACSLTPTTDLRWIGRASLLSELLTLDSKRADEALKKMFENATSELRGKIFNAAVRNNDPILASYVGDNLSDIDPSPVLSYASPKWNFSIRKNSKDIPEWLEYLSLLGQASRNETNYFENISRTESAFYATVRPLGLNSEAWTWLSEAPAVGASWNAIKTVGRFAVSPNKETLAAALLALAEENCNVPAATPWPIIACLRYASMLSINSKESANEVLKVLSESARTGALGDVDDWLSAQNRWDDVIPITVKFVRENTGDSGTRFLSPGISDTGFVPEAFFYIGNHSKKMQDEELIELVTALVDGSKDQPTWLELAFHFVEMSSRYIPDANSNSMPKVLQLLAESKTISSTRHLPIRWIGTIPTTQLVNNIEFLKSIGSVENLVGVLSRERSVELLDLALKCTDSYPIARIALKSHGELLKNISSTELGSIIPEYKADIRRVLFASWKILFASPEDVHSGNLDHELMEVVDSPDEQFNINWLNRALTSVSQVLAREISTRGVQLHESSQPELSQDWIETSRRLTKIMPELVSIEKDND